MMQVIVRPRQGGKTTAIIKWLLAGSLKTDGNWSRIIVCLDEREVKRLTKLVLAATGGWPRVSIQEKRAMQNAIVARHNMETRLLGTQVECGIDNLEMFLGIYPEIVTMTGELYDE